MHASRRQQQACVGKAAAGGICACVALVTVRSDRGHRPERLLLAACSSYLGISCVSADHRATGRPWATAVALASHTSRGSSSLRHRCGVRSRTGQWACPATRAASCSAADGRRTASARSVSIGQIMRAPSHAIDHHRSKPSLEPILPRATKRGACGCDDGSATRRTCSCACPRWSTRIRQLGVPCASEKRANR